MQIKNLTWLWVTMIAACLITTDVFAQRPGDERDGRGRPERGRDGGREGRGGPGGGRGGPGGGRGGFGGFMRMLPIMAALDADEDGEISAKEIENAVVALKKLDKNKDGKLTEDELRPNFSGRGFGGPGGPPGGGRGFGGPGGGGGNRGASPEQIVERFMRMDENKDGKLQKDEIAERMQDVFARADANKDDVVTKEELTKMAEQMAARGGRGGREGGGRGGFGGDRGGRGSDRPRRPQRPE